MEASSDAKTMVVMRPCSREVSTARPIDVHSNAVLPLLSVT